MNRLGRFARSFGTALAEGPVGRVVMPGPLDLFQSEQRHKLASFVRGTNVMGSSTEPGLIDGYFQGRNFAPTEGGIGFSEANDRLAMMRRRAGYAAGGLMAANVFGIDPLGMSSAINNLTRS